MPEVGYPVFGVVGVVEEGHVEAVGVGGEPSGEESQEAGDLGGVVGTDAGGGRGRAGPPGR